MLHMESYIHFSAYVSLHSQVSFSTASKTAKLIWNRFQVASILIIGCIQSLAMDLTRLDLM